MKQLRGIVMCGGQSKRMGTDKGLIPIYDTCWAAHSAAKLAFQNLLVSISVNSSQQPGYEKVFSVDQLIVDNLTTPGPLNGLLSAHLKFPDDDLLILACDMINMQAITLKRLVDTYRLESDYDFYVYQNGAYAEPFCGIYTAKGLRDTRLRLEGLKHEDVSLQKVLNDGDTKRLQIIEDSSFENHNTPF